MALLLKSAISYTCLTTRVKHLVPKLKATFRPFSASSSGDSTKPIATMIEYEVVPDVIAVAPKDKLEVNFKLLLSTHPNFLNAFKI